MDNLNPKDGHEYISIKPEYEKSFCQTMILSALESAGLKISIYSIGKSEIILDIPENGYGFSMKDLKAALPDGVTAKKFIQDGQERIYPNIYRITY